jgi:leucyl/phenylalanyl-tRNA--protein transferase
VRRNDPVILTPATLLSAYAQGAFPMSRVGRDEVEFYTCSVRCVIPLDRFHASDSLMRRVRSGRFGIHVNRDFAATMAACATDRARDNRTWISPSMQVAYGQLHRLGHAHSVEAYRDGLLVGGLYGVTLGGAFFGESMFSRQDLGGTDASKVCLVHLVARLRERGFTLLDSQYANSHVLRFGAEEIPAEEYLRRLRTAIEADAAFD